MPVRVVLFPNRSRSLCLKSTKKVAQTDSLQPEFELVKHDPTRTRSVINLGNFLLQLKDLKLYF